MSDNEQREETTSRGNEWEVVQLTASTYAAAPGPEKAEEKAEKKFDTSTHDDAETSRALFMSRHFVFPPSQHENLPLESDNSDEIVESVAIEHGVEEGDTSGGSGKDFHDGMSEGLDVSKELPGRPIVFVVDEGNKLPTSGFHDAATYGSHQGETEIGETTFGQNLSVPGVDELLERDFDLPIDVSEPVNDDKQDGSKLPSEAWWKRTAASLKEGNTFWSIFIAAAFMGLVILGQRWQQERLQVLQHKWQKNGRMLGSLYRLKEVIVGGNRRSSSIRGSDS